MYQFKMILCAQNLYSLKNIMSVVSHSKSVKLRRHLGYKPPYIFLFFGVFHTSILSIFSMAEAIISIHTKNNFR